MEVLNPARSQARNPLFQVMLSFQNMEQSVLRLGDLTVAGIDANTVAAKFDLQLTMVEQFDEAGAPAGDGGAVHVRDGFVRRVDGGRLCRQVRAHPC